MLPPLLLRWLPFQSRPMYDAQLFPYRLMRQVHSAVQLPPAIGPEAAPVAQEGVTICLTLGKVAQIMLPHQS